MIDWDQLYKGMKVRCVSAKYGRYIREMNSLIGETVMIERWCKDSDEIYLKECPTYIWSLEDFELPQNSLIEPTDDEFMSVLLCL